ncbi:hypothetical protein AVEN_268798-1 [Araneus ventricosus]|uniref:Uncharacterized protein n=1 Tax=Araneus ventricosus TaxID=182803 RepID=A0A4Y2UAF8_ARAVE|nr:hypothetical protein AVEN_268798-1 [Araneus ventricosus]
MLLKDNTRHLRVTCVVKINRIFENGGASSDSLQLYQSVYCNSISLFDELQMIDYTINRSIMYAVTTQSNNVRASDKTHLDVKTLKARLVDVINWMPISDRELTTGLWI